MPWHGPDGHRLYYEDTGRGDPVVLMAGWVGSIIELSPLRAALLPGFRVIAVDLPGSGRSEP
jgi:valacyclovir hydrolase